MANLLKEATYEQLVQGYRETEAYYVCLVCGKVFEKGEIFEENGRFYEAKKMVEIHTEKEHGKIIDLLFEMDGKDFGLTESQLGMLKAFAYDLSDEEIFEEHQITPSTIRNYRQKLREREQQAKHLAALTHLIEQEKQNGTMHLNRKEKQIVQNSFYTDGTLKEIPSKEKKRMVVLKQIVRPLKVGKVYTKQEIDKYLKNIYLHYEDLRQTLIDAGLLLEGENQTYSKVKTK